ncbi:TfuA domain-containing protein [Sorangium sp. So ce136]|uniref:TfuA-like protein n=1 Tax=Sorangium sp. So ce136 TaxID=3133284 RepID=UPI003F05DA5D
MTIYIFAGPTIPAALGQGELAAVFLPPAAQGDVYRAALQRPAAIGIVDGYFERVPSVSHKEILWAMAQGTHVFGSASLGALRAVELEPLGMEGVGAVYEAFRSGELEDEDEVAVAHATAEHGYRPLSEAMVNLRATLRRAEQEGILTSPARAALVRIAKEIFYPERSYPALLAKAASSGVDPAALDALRAFLREGRVDQKREDAIAMLRVIRQRFSGAVAPKQVAYAFEHTDAWEFIRRNAAEAGAATGGAPPALLEELSLSGRYLALFRGAVARSLALDAAARSGRTVKDEALLAASEEFRAERELFRPEEFQRWVSDNEIEAIERFIEDEAHLQWAERVFASDAARLLADHLRASGEYAPLLRRARHKERVLAAPASDPSAGVSDAELDRWYFEERMGRPVPRTLERYARAAGFGDLDAMRVALRRELAYLRAGGGAERG